jgi:HAD superfamily hydrolase (TIGR01662 family)
VGGVDPRNLDAVTLDAYGTLVELDGHIERLRSSLAAAGADVGRAEVERAFEVEVAYYAEHKCGAADDPALATLRRDCARAFTAALGLELDFATAFADAIRFRPLPGVVEALAELRARGLALAVVSNWDCGLARELDRAGIAVDVVVTCAGAGVAKPAPGIFHEALKRLGVTARRTLHVGDDSTDKEGAAAAGLHYAPAPLADVVAAWP